LYIQEVLATETHASRTLRSPTLTSATQNAPPNSAPPDNAPPDSTPPDSTRSDNAPPAKRAQKSGKSHIASDAGNVVDLTFKGPMSVVKMLRVMLLGHSGDLVSCDLLSRDRMSCDLYHVMRCLVICG
jgi:hypothetical protein